MGLAFLCLAMGLGVGDSASAAEPPRIETVMERLHTPYSVAVQPETGEIFVSESGAGRIVRIVGGQPQEVVVGFPVEPFRLVPAYRVGPLGMTFANRGTLVVGEGGLAAGADLVRLFEVPAAGQPPIPFDRATTRLGPLIEEGTTPGEGDFLGIAAAKGGLYVTCLGDDTKGWLARAELNAGKYGDLKRFIATRPAVSTPTPAALAVSPRGDLVVGHCGQIDTPRDSLLAFYHATSGKLLLKLPLPLHDPAGLAYSPQSQALFAVDAAWSHPNEGGLFQLVAERTPGGVGVAARKIAPLERPTSLAFAPDGTLYITLLGAPGEGEAAKTGKLVKISGLDPVVEATTSPASP